MTNYDWVILLVAAYAAVLIALPLFVLKIRNQVCQINSRSEKILGEFQHIASSLDDIANYIRQQVEK